MSGLNSGETRRNIIEPESEHHGLPSPTSGTGAYPDHTQKPEQETTPEKADRSNSEDQNCPISAYVRADHDSAKEKLGSSTAGDEGQLKAHGSNDHPEADVLAHSPVSNLWDFSHPYVPASTFRRGVVPGGVIDNNDCTPDPDPTYYNSYTAEATTGYGLADDLAMGSFLPFARSLTPIQYARESSQLDSEFSMTALSIIASIMMNPNVDVIEAAMTLEDLLRECRESDAPFFSLLEVPVEGYDMPPLAIEASRCDFDGAPDLLLFLAENTSTLHRLKYIRQGCMIRKDDLFEKLRPMWLMPSSHDTPPPFEYVVSLQQYATPYTSVFPDKRMPNTFRALVSIPDFATALQANATALDVRFNTSHVKGPDGFPSGTNLAETLEVAAKEASLAVEVIALRRYWTLEIKRNKLVLNLMDGPECSVDASLTVIEEEFADLAPAVLYALEHPGAPIPEDLHKPRPTHPAPTQAMPDATQGQLTKDADSTSAPLENSEPATRTGTSAPFFFPQARLYPRSGPMTPTRVDIPRCFPSNGWPSNFSDTTLVSNQLLVQLVVRLYDEQDGLVAEDHARVTSSSIGATGAASSLASGSMGYRSQTGSSSAGAWSVIHEGDMFDTDDSDETVSYTGENSDRGDGSDDDESGFEDLGGSSIARRSLPVVKMEGSSNESCEHYYEAQHRIVNRSLPPTSAQPPSPAGAYPPYVLQCDAPPENLLTIHLAERDARIAAASTDGVNRPHIIAPPPHTNLSSRERVQLARQVRFGPVTQGRVDDPFMRTDRRVRTTTLDVISSVMMNPNVSVVGAVMTLEDLRDQCRDAGVPFSELLEVEIEGYDMVPLMIEIIRCMLRNDDLFEKLRQITPCPSELGDAPHFEYVVSLDQYTTPLTRVASTPNNTFRALISIENFAAALDQNAEALEFKRRRRDPEKRALPWSKLVDAEPGLICEIVALGRCWSFEVGVNRLILTLVDGLECNVDASVIVIMDELGPAPGVEDMGEMVECPTTPTVQMTGLNRKDPVSRPASTLVELLETASMVLEPEEHPRAAADSADEDFDLCDDAPSTRSASLDSAITEAASSKPAPPKPKLPDTALQFPTSLEDEPRGERLSTTYVELIKWAILGSPGQRATVKQIVDKIRGEFPFYARAEGFELLKAGVRQRISTSPMFHLLDEGPEDSEDRGGYWIYVGQGADATISSPVVTTPTSQPTAPIPETAQALPVPRANPFVFPQATLYPRHSSTSKHYVVITECYSPNSPRGCSNFIGAALGSGQLLLQLVVRLYDELDTINASSSVIDQPATSLGATGAASATDVGVRSGYRSRAVSSAGGWSVVDNDEVFDSDDGEVSYVGRNGEFEDAIADNDSDSAFSDL
ncbi:hypothetical protein FRB98_006573 [Tulasnella sp. 332]|nr:hypothetical protein FRB98_006573 [Tulasnella sp. 332]